MKRIGIVGYGSRIRRMAEELERFGRDIAVVAAVDPAEQDLRERYPERMAGVIFYPDATAMLDEAGLDGVMIGTRCNIHTELAIQVLERDLPLYLEKPVSIEEEQLLRLHAASQRREPKVVVGFPLRLSTLAREAKAILDSGTIGTIENVQAINNVPFYGSNYYHGWMRDDSLTGGLWLQKATHDLDYLTHLVGQLPERIVAVESKTVFTGDMPAGLSCVDCPHYTTCPESQYNLFTLQGIMDTLENEEDWWGGQWRCSFAVDTGNHDAATAILQYPSGAHLTYTQNFYARRTAAKRGASFIGYKGTLEFDWYRGEIVVHHHLSGRVERHDYSGREIAHTGRPGGGSSGGGAHFGGDMELARDFLNLLFGEGESRATLEDGLISAQLCLMAKRSCETNAFQTYAPLSMRQRELANAGVRR
ncbi:MAG TPA: Gfo/Idh/MocA family oxidoreductase [Thermomicrobiales bacterium]|nr:Gfo/Idh/MocA family oxidoreductase [Thermomicrobiales bacterium]